ncbi:hypothetical protein VB779_11040 [Haloarculaceae archaeon H-GB11]|nr:hypothetical protein [Haloarculaceae archaeon H-GB11]
MDDAALQVRLARIERQQQVVILLLVIPYVLGVAKLLGFWPVGVALSALAILAFGAVAVSRRRRRDSAT